MTAQSKNTADHFAEINVKSIGSLMSAAADLVLIVDRDGCIKDVVGDQANDLGFAVSDLVGQNVHSLASPDAELALNNLLETADDIPKMIGLAHLNPDGRAIEITYRVLSLGLDKDVIFLGQDQSKIAALEERLQAAELNSQRQNARKKQDAAEFRALFSINQHPILIVSAMTGMVKEANNAALSTLGFDRAQLLGQHLENIFAKSGRKAITALLDQTKTSETEATATRINSNQSVHLTSLQGVVGHDSLIVRLTPQTDVARVENLDQALAAIANISSDYMAVVDGTGKMLWSNDRLLTLMEQVADLNANLQDYLNCDFLDLLTQTQKLGRLSIATQVRSSTDTMTPAELSLISLQNMHQGLFGVSVTPTPSTEESKSVLRPWPTQKIGSVPLSALVREEVDLIEKSCIEAALKLTGNNRQATAKVLGISRQGLYDKLRRFKLLKE